MIASYSCFIIFSIGNIADYPNAVVAQPVYVSSFNGNDSTHCGTIVQPCNQLQTALDQSEDEIVIIGELLLNHSVTVKRNMTIRGDINIGDAIIKGQGRAYNKSLTLQYNKMYPKKKYKTLYTQVYRWQEANAVFKMMEGINVNITGIRFVNIAVAEIGTNTRCSVNNCVVTGDIGRVFQFADTTLLNASLEVMNSTFMHIEGSIIMEYRDLKQRVVVIFSDSHFLNISCNGVINSWNLIRLMVFSRCSISDMVCIYSCRSKSRIWTRNIFSWDWPDCTYNRTQPDLAWSIIFITHGDSLIISGSSFNNIRRYWNLIEVHATKTVVVHTNSFRGNRHVRKAVDIGLDETVTAIISKNNFHNNNLAYILSLYVNGDCRNLFMNGCHVSSKYRIDFHNNFFGNNEVRRCIVDFNVCCYNIFISDCNFKSNIGGTLGFLSIASYTKTTSASTIISNTNFYNNTAKETSQAINYQRGDPLTLRNVTVTSLNAQDSLYHIVIRSMGEIVVENVTIDIQTPGKDMISHGMFIVTPMISKSSTFFVSCPMNYNVQLDLDKGYNSLTIKCGSCTEGLYSLLRGTLKLPKLTTDYKKHLNEGIVECKECPMGGKCSNGNFRSSPNFWGFNKSNQLIFVPCPIGHCCTSEGTPCHSFDTCTRGRTGVLCGQCEQEYRLNFFNNSCVKVNAECNESLFICYIVIYSWCTTLLFLYITNITDVIKSIWKFCKITLICSKFKHWAINKLKKIIPRVQQQTASAASSKIPKQVVFHMLIYFYQLAKLLHVKVEKQSLKNGFLEGLKTNVTNFVYFRFIFHVHTIICPTTSLNFLQKSGINLAFHFSTLTNLLLFLIIAKLIVLLKRRTRCMFSECFRLRVWIPASIRALTRSPSVISVSYDERTVQGQNQNADYEQDDLPKEQSQDKSQEREDQQEHQQVACHEQNETKDYDPTQTFTGEITVSLPEVGVHIDDEEMQLLYTTVDNEDEVHPIIFAIRAKLTFIQLLKTIYTPVAYICFRLIYCIPINDINHLYFYGEVMCYTWWQKIILIFALPGIFLFPLSFGMALCLLKKEQIVTTQFLIAASIPYYAIYLYLKIYLVGLHAGCFSISDASFVEKQLESDNKVFREQDQLISWPVIQLYRNLLVVAINTFIINPIYRNLAFLPIFSVFLLHDRSAKPFKNKVINIFQTSSTACLSVIIICNMVFSFTLYMTNIGTIQHMGIVLTVLSYIENIMYIVFPLMLPISILWREYCERSKGE